MTAIAKQWSFFLNLRLSKFVPEKCVHSLDGGEVMQIISYQISEARQISLTM